MLLVYVIASLFLFGRLTVYGSPCEITRSIFSQSGGRVFNQERGQLKQLTPPPQMDLFGA
jgi:hypothetical protein